MPSSAEAAKTGMRIPVRSDQRPSSMPAAPNPSIVSVYGNDAPARATPNSACTVGSATTTDHIPTPPIVDSARASARRRQDCGESTVAGDMPGVYRTRLASFAKVNGVTANGGPAYEKMPEQALDEARFDQPRHA